MNRFLVLGFLTLVAMASLWTMWRRRAPESEDVTFRQQAARRELVTRPRTNPLSDARQNWQGEDADYPDHTSSVRATRPGLSRPQRAAGSAEVEHGTIAKPLSAGDQVGRAGPDEASRSGVLTDAPMEESREAGSPETTVAQALGAVLSFPLRDGKVESNGLAPAVAEDVHYDEVAAFFGPLARFIVMPPPDLPSFAGTVSFWVQPDWTGEAESNAAYFQWRTHTFANRIQIFKNGPFLRFLLANDAGVESGVAINILRWRPGEWHSVTATWGDGVASLYIDGAPAGSQEYDGEIAIPPGTPWYIGSDHPEGAPGARSRIRGFQIYPRALSYEEVLQVVGATQPPLS